MSKEIEYYIRSSVHPTSFANTGKKDDLHRVVTEMRRVLQLMIDHLWKHGLKWKDKKGIECRFSIEENLLDFPPFIDYSIFDIDTFLSARALSSLATQAAGIIKAAIQKQKKRLYIYEKKKAEGTTKSKLKPLIRAIKTNIPQKPNCSNINIELSSKCCDWQDASGEFIGFLRLKSITKDRTEIRIPIKGHKHSKKLASKGTRMNSFLISPNKVDVRWKIEKPALKDEGEVVGADQGMKTILTCSNEETTPPHDIHGHDLTSIMQKLSRKKKGSKAFKRAQDHRTNFINWSINQLNFSNIKELRLEEIINIGYKNKTSRMMSHWTNTAIRDKIETMCEESGVRLTLQSSTYRSQRCSSCGVVRKANRKGKTYKCKHCGFECDADLNASLNHIVDLPEIPYTLRKAEINRGNGFYWKPDGFFDFESGRRLESLPPVEDKK